MKTNNILIILGIIAAFFWLKKRNKSSNTTASKTIAPKPPTPTVKPAPTPAPVKPPIIPAVTEEEKPGIIAKEDEKTTPIFSTASTITATAQAPAPVLTTQEKKEVFGAQPNILKLQELAKLKEMEAAAVIAPPATSTIKPIVETILNIISPKPRITLSKELSTKAAASSVYNARFSGHQKRWK